jgi:hypothetical protein
MSTIGRLDARSQAASSRWSWTAQSCSLCDAIGGMPGTVGAQVGGRIGADTDEAAEPRRTMSDQLVAAICIVIAIIPTLTITTNNVSAR